MVNVSLSLAGLLGILNILFGLFYSAVSIAQVITTIRNSGAAIDIAFRLAQVLIAPILLILSGLILCFQGWRLDPLLSLQQLLIEILVLYLAIRDIQR